MQFENAIQEKLQGLALKQANAMHRIGDNVKGVAHVAAAHGAEQQEHDVRMHVAELNSLIINTRRMIEINAEHNEQHFKPAEIIANLNSMLALISGK